VADPLDVLDEQVDRFGRAVAGAAGGVPGQHLGLPAADGVGQPADLRNAGGVAVVVVDGQRGAGRAVGEIINRSSFYAPSAGRCLATVVDAINGGYQQCGFYALSAGRYLVT